MADLSRLGGLKPVDVQLDLNEGVYADVKRSAFQLPKAGRYTLQSAPVTPESFSETAKGALAYALDPTVIGPENAGFKLRFISVYSTPYKRNGMTVSGIGDYLRATGFRGKLDDLQQTADAIELVAGTPFTADIDWIARDRKTGFEVKGMRNFPVLEDGTHQSWLPHPTLKDENGAAVRVRANLEIVRYIAAEG